MGVHAAIIRLSPLIHEGKQRYKPYKVGDPGMVSLLNITSSLCDPPPPLPHFEKSWLRPLYALVRQGKEVMGITAAFENLSYIYSCS